MSAPASVLPEQCANWAYPDATMSPEQTAFSMIAGVVGRLYLSGFLHDLGAEQQDLVADAVRIHKRLRSQIAGSLPEWPLGLPGWDDEIVALMLTSGTEHLLAVQYR